MVILDSDLLKDNRKFSKPTNDKNCCKNVFFQIRKNSFKKALPALLPREYFYLYIIK